MPTIGTDAYNNSRSHHLRGALLWRADAAHAAVIATRGAPAHGQGDGIPPGPSIARLWKPNPRQHEKDAITTATTNPPSTSPERGGVAGGVGAAR